MSEIPINLYFEDALSGAVLRKLLNHAGKNYSIGVFHNSGGCDWIKDRLNIFNKAAKGMPYLILIDLDNNECAPVLLNHLLDNDRHSNLILRIAVREVESWLLADRNPFADYLGISSDRITRKVEKLTDPKEHLIDLVRKSTKRSVKMDILPLKDSKTGPDYNARLIDFVIRYWNPNEARKYSPSLDRAITALERFKPILQKK